MADLQRDFWICETPTGQKKIKKIYNFSVSILIKKLGAACKAKIM